GINTIFAPVLDINTNPLNPIISTRAFGEDPETVSFFGCEMIRILQDNGIASCGKHFPGHGDTETDSHISLPLIKKELQLLEKTELVPFRKAIKTGVKMIMLGHLSVPAIDPSGIPASISEKAIRYLRDKMGFNGITITDALNMGGLAQITKATKNVKSLHSPFTKRGRGGIFEIASPEPALSDKTRFFARLRRAQNDRIVIEEEASLMALRAGVDLLLHPTDPDRVASYLEKTNYYPASSTINRLEVFRRTHCCLAEPVKPHPFFERHKKLSEELARKAINIKGEMKPMKKPFLILLNDDEAEKGGILINVLKSRYPNLRYISFCSQMPVIGSQFRDKIGSQIIVAVFSRIKAWKGETAPWLKRAIKELEERAKIFVSFGSPYLFDGIKNDITKIYAYWDSETVQKAVAELICLLSNPPLPPFSKGG
ncbi:MAG: glycoside hydrolase family 3 N-terminal domain-containing protein, partial [Nitrospirota bacterium]